MEYVGPVVYWSVLTCMRFARVKLALVINFHAVFLKEGIKRLVLGLEEWILLYRFDSSSRKVRGGIAKSVGVRLPPGALRVLCAFCVNTS